METQLSDPTQDLDDHVQNSSLAVHNEHNEAIVAFESDRSPVNGMYVVRYDYNGFPICSTSPADDFPVRMDNPSPAGLHKHVSISMRKAHTLYLGFDSAKKFFGNWVAIPVSPGGSKSRLMQFSVPKETMPTAAFSDANFGQIAIGGSDTEDIAPSSALSGASGLGWESDFSNDLRPNSGPNQRGLLRLIDSATTGELLRCCDGPTSDPCDDESCAVQYQVYNPCVARRDDGITVICWAEKEVPGVVGSAFFNIALRVYSGTTLIASIDRDNADDEPNSVNEPNRDILLTNQTSPAVDIDPCGNIICVWVGPLPNNKTSPSTPCSTADDFTVYARRLHLDGSELVFKSRQYRVDTSGEDWKLGTDPALIHPTVALLQTHKQPSSGEQLQGRHLIGWNAIHRDSDQWSVRGQFFHADGKPWAREFDLSPYKDSNGDPDGIDRTLAESNQHTLAYAQGLGDATYTSFATWTETEGSEHRVWLTKIEPQFYVSEEADLGVDEKCVKGDLYADPGGPPFHNGVVDQDDILPFIDVLLTAGQPFICDDALALDFCRADTNSDGLVNGLDVQCFVSFIVAGTPCPSGIAADCADPEFSSGELVDCNENETDDSQDIRRGTSLDCNNDGVPDECQLSENDCDENGVPDDCQLWTEDCNHNGIVDYCDIAAETSDDCDSNGVPDECQPDCNNNDVADVCDIADEESDDCNENGVPDECEDDCNNNDVADECDIANSTSEDCNENGVPDECDISRAMLPSLDCNDNDIPDECELVGNDENENGIPDDCEEESLMGGGGGGESMMSGGGEGEGSEFDEAAAWELFYEWYDDQVFGEGSDWGTLSGSERFHRIMDEIELLGLPYAAPW